MNLILPCYSIILLLLLVIVYFRKVEVKTEETKMYCVLLFLSLFNVIFNIIGIYLGYFDGESSFLRLLNHLDLPLYFWWSYCILMYLLYTYIYVIKDKKNSYFTFKYIVLVFNIICTIITVFLPFDIILTKEAGYIVGNCVNFTYIISGVYLLLSLIVSLILVKYNFKKTIPLFSLILLGVVSALIQKNVPSLIIVPSVAVFVELIMYFTIENPDIKLLNELYKNKTLVEQSYEDKYNFLFEMTEKVKQPIVNMKKYVDDIENNQNNNIEEKIKLLNYELENLNFLINDVLDISSIDISRVKKKDIKYNLKNVIDKLIIQVKSDLKIDNKLNTNISNNLPILYGDYILIQQILYSIIVDTFKKSENNSVDFKVNLLEKSDTCRIIFNIKSEKNIYSLQEINDILNVSTELSDNDIKKLEDKKISIKLCQKLIKLIGGHLMIKSNHDGTEIIFIIDQKKLNNDKKMDNQFNVINETGKVLVLSSDKELIAKTKRIINKYEFNFSTILDENYAIDMLKNNKEFKLILVSNKINLMSGYEFMQKIKDNNIKVPIVIMLNKNEDELAKHFIKDGFNDCLILENLEEEMKRLIKKI